MSKFTRRNFTKTSLLAAGVLFFPGCAIKEEDASYHFFTKEEANCVIALCEQIIPADKEFGGATDAEVIYYIDRQLTDFYKVDQKMYRTGLAALQASSKKLNGKLFENLDFEEQTEFLRNMERSKLPNESWGNINQNNFFKTVKKHTIEGFYSNPQHGGNKDYISFKMMRIEEPYMF